MKKIFWNKVSALFAMYLYIGIPPLIAPFPKIRLAKTAEKILFAIIPAIEVISLGVYWQSGCNNTIISAFNERA